MIKRFIFYAFMCCLGGFVTSCKPSSFGEDSIITEIIEHEILTEEYINVKKVFPLAVASRAEATAATAEMTHEQAVYYAQIAYILFRYIEVAGKNQNENESSRQATTFLSQLMSEFPELFTLAAEVNAYERPEMYIHKLAELLGPRTDNSKHCLWGVCIERPLKVLTVIAVGAITVAFKIMYNQCRTQPSVAIPSVAQVDESE